MKIKVINPPNVPFSSRGILIEPIDVLSTASFIVSLGHDVDLLDMDVGKIPAENYSNSIKSTDYDIAVIIYDYHIPLHCDGTLDAVQEIARQAKSHGAKVIIGGKTATYKPEQLLNTDNIDVLIKHEMEPALIPLLKEQEWTNEILQNISGISFKDNKGNITSTHRKSHVFDIQKMPIPDRNLINLDDYIDVRTILSSRGCHMKCDFCHVPGFWGNWRGRSAKDVADEIEYLVNEYDAKKILFLDDNTTVNKKRMHDICDHLIERQVKVAMGCLGSLSLYDRPMMEKMYLAGFRWIHYGVESGDNRLLGIIHKRIESDDVRRIITETKAIGFRVRSSWIMDLPDTTEEELQRTVDLILELKTDEIRLHHLALRMGSTFYEEFPNIQSTQYIHQKSQNQNLCNLSPQRIEDVTENIASQLSTSNYAVVRDPEEFLDINALTVRSENLQIVSFCPLRYGLGWRF